MKGLRQLVTNAKWPLCSRPDGEAVALPLRDGGARLKRRVGYVLDGVLLVDTDRRACQRLLHGAGRGLRAVTGVGTVLENFKKLAVGGLRRHIPLGAQKGDSFLGGESVGRDHPDEIAFVDELNAAEFFRGRSSRGRQV